MFLAEIMNPLKQFTVDYLALFFHGETRSWIFLHGSIKGLEAIIILKERPSVV